MAVVDQLVAHHRLVAERKQHPQHHALKTPAREIEINTLRITHSTRGTDFPFQIFPFSVSEFNKFCFFPFSILYSTDVFSITHFLSLSLSLSLFLSFSLSLYLSQTAGLKNKINMRERNVLFNDALNTFYLRLYGVTHMVKGPLR